MSSRKPLAGCPKLQTVFLKVSANYPSQLYPDYDITSQAVATMCCGFELLQTCSASLAAPHATETSETVGTNLNEGCLTIVPANDQIVAKCTRMGCRSYLLRASVVAA